MKRHVPPFGFEMWVGLVQHGQPLPREHTASARGFAVSRHRGPALHPAGRAGNAERRWERTTSLVSGPATLIAPALGLPTRSLWRPGARRDRRAKQTGGAAAGARGAGARQRVWSRHGNGGAITLLDPTTKRRRRPARIRLTRVTLQPSSGGHRDRCRHRLSGPGGQQRARDVTFTKVISRVGMLTWAR